MFLLLIRNQWLFGFKFLYFIRVSNIFSNCFFTKSFQHWKTLDF
jgi:hypothetical protein